MFHKSGKVFIPDNEFVWIRAQITKNISNTHVEVQLEENLPGLDNSTSQTRIVALNTTLDAEFPSIDRSIVGVDDMCNLNYLHEPGILDNLRIRFESIIPYTYVGDI